MTYAEWKLKITYDKNGKEKSHSPAQGDQLLQHRPELEGRLSGQPWGLPAGPSVATWGCTWAARTESAPRPWRSLRSSSPWQLWFVPAVAGSLFPDEMCGRRTWKSMVEKFKWLQRNGMKQHSNVYILSVMIAKKSHLQKTVPPVWLTDTHSWLLSSSRFGFACVLTGPAAGEMWNIISLCKCCMLSFLQKTNHGFSDVSCV